jgi:hypothetical protein
MSLSATCWWTLVRTVVLCLLAWPVSRLIERTLNHAAPARRAWLMTGLLATCCFPEMLVGYAYRDIAMAHPQWAEFLCSVLLFVRIVPVGTLALLAAPPSRLDAASIHCRRLAGGSRFELARCYWHGPILRALPGLALMSLLAYQEFELAALLQTMSWTDWFVVAQREGLERAEMLRRSLWPLLTQAPVLLAVVYWLRQGPKTQDVGEDLRTSDIPCDARTAGLGPAFVFACVVLGCLIPLGMIGWRTLEGLQALVRYGPQQRGLMWEMTTSLAVAICAGTSAWAIGGRMKGMLALGLLPGLAGSLLLSLACVAMFQATWLRPLYDTPVPWVLALLVWLLPRAAVLRLWLDRFQRDESIHTALILQQSDVRGGSSPARPGLVLWQLRDQPRFLAVSLLCYWAYCDLPIAYLLAPSRMASGLVRLYNFMHFGRSAALSAEASVFFGVPVLCLFLILLLMRKFR